MSTPEALRIAALLEKIDGQHWQVQDSAAELLRRQHAEIEGLTAENSALAQALLLGDAEFKRLTAERDALRKALEMAVRQNEHDMLMTGDELRACRAVMAGDKP